MLKRRKITKPTLLLHNFKQLENDKNVWIKRVPIRHSHDALIYTYQYKERILKYTCYDCVWSVQYTGQICNEQEAYKEIIIN